MNDDKQREKLFQSTPPRRGRPLRYAVEGWRKVFQSTPPRRGRLPFWREFNFLTAISIHAPAQGATVPLR